MDESQMYDDKADGIHPPASRASEAPWGARRAPRRGLAWPGPLGWAPRPVSHHVAGCAFRRRISRTCVALRRDCDGHCDGKLPFSPACHPALAPNNSAAAQLPHLSDRRSLVQSGLLGFFQRARHPPESSAMGSVGAGDENVVEVSDLEFAYGGQPSFISKFSLQLKKGSRCLLIGANGAGKTTLLRILAGKHLVGGKNVVRVLGRSAFHDTALTCSGQLAYLGGSWSRTVGCAGEIPLQGDFSAEHMIFGVENVDPARRARLIELLDIDLRWRMHKVSDGQRRRVQICMGLLQPFQVLLLDEITVDLDVVARMDLLSFFVDECAERGATLIYATHIFDGLESWATDIAYVEDGKLKRAQPINEIPELLPPSEAKNLIQVVEPWLRTEREEREKRGPSTEVKLDRVTRPSDVSPFTSSRQMAYYR